MFFFFFSSRRRHTRFKCDWSSDVCSSDLEQACYAKVKSPAELVAGVMRTVEDFTFPKHGIREIALECRYMGQDLLNPPSVEGWHVGKEWIDTGILVERINFAAAQVGDVDKPGVRKIVDRLRAMGDPLREPGGSL